MSSERLDSLAERPIADLIADPLQTDHAWFRSELDRLVALADRIRAAEGDRPDFPQGLVECLRDLREAMRNHIDSEELVVFPLLDSGQAAQAQDAIRGLELEHVDVENVVRRLRSLTHDLEAPAGAGSDWRELYESFAAFEARKRFHNEVESKVLFPRVLYADADPTDRSKE